MPGLDPFIPITPDNVSEAISYLEQIIPRRAGSKAVTESTIDEAVYAAESMRNKQAEFFKQVVKPLCTDNPGMSVIFNIECKQAEGKVNSSGVDDDVLTFMFDALGRFRDCAVAPKKSNWNKIQDPKPALAPRHNKIFSSFRKHHNQDTFEKDCVKRKTPWEIHLYSHGLETRFDPSPEKGFRELIERSNVEKRVSLDEKNFPDGVLNQLAKCIHQAPLKDHDFYDMLANILKAFLNTGLTLAFPERTLKLMIYDTGDSVGKIGVQMYERYFCYQNEKNAWVISADPKQALLEFQIILIIQTKNSLKDDKSNWEMEAIWRDRDGHFTPILARHFFNVSQSVKNIASTPKNYPENLKKLQDITPDSLRDCYNFLQLCCEEPVKYQDAFDFFNGKLFLPFVMRRKILSERFYKEEVTALLSFQKDVNHVRLAKSIIEDLLFSGKCLIDPCPSGQTRLHDPINALALHKMVGSFSTPHRHHDAQLHKDASRRAWDVSSGENSILINEKTGFLDLALQGKDKNKTSCPYLLPVEVANQLNKFYKQGKIGVPNFYDIVYAMMEAFSSQGIGINGGDQIRHIHIDPGPDSSHVAEARCGNGQIAFDETGSSSVRHAVIVFFSQQFFSYTNLRDQRDFISASPDCALFEFNFRLTINLSQGKRDGTYPWELDVHYADHTPDRKFSCILEKLVQERCPSDGRSSPETSYIRPVPNPQPPYFTYGDYVRLLQTLVDMYPERHGWACQQIRAMEQKIQAEIAAASENDSKIDGVTVQHKPPENQGGSKAKKSLNFGNPNNQFPQQRGNGAPGALPNDLGVRPL